MAEENVIYIGKKSAMAYVLAAITEFNGGATEITLKARGRTISRAVDVAEIVRNRFLTDVKIKNIKIGTDEVQSERGTAKVSSIEIVLAK